MFNSDVLVDVRTNKWLSQASIVIKHWKCYTSKPIRYLRLLIHLNRHQLWSDSYSLGLRKYSKNRKNHQIGAQLISGNLPCSPRSNGRNEIQEGCCIPSSRSGLGWPRWGWDRAETELSSATSCTYCTSCQRSPSSPTSGSAARWKWSRRGTRSRPGWGGWTGAGRGSL